MDSALYILHRPDDDVLYLPSQLLLYRSYKELLANHDVIVLNFDTAYERLAPENRSPFIHYEDTNYAYLSVDNGLCLLFANQRNFLPMLIIVFLHQFYDVLNRYLGKSDNRYHRCVDKDVIIDNVCLVYELIDECMDFGIVQLTDYNILKEFIKMEACMPNLTLENDYYSDSEEEHSMKRKKIKNKRKDIKVTSTKNRAVNSDVLSVGDTFVNTAVLKTFSHAIHWRPKGIFYPKNEIYIDLVEDNEFIYDLEKKQVKKNYIHGKCKVRCYLSGMPICKIGFNEQHISLIDGADVDNESIKEESQLKDAVVDDDFSDDGFPETVNSDLNHNSIDRKSSIPLENIQYHQCIELGKVYKNNIINFVPPDDEFTLITYSVDQTKRRKKPLFMVDVKFRTMMNSKKLQILCVLYSHYKKRLQSPKTIVRIPINPYIFDINYNPSESDSFKFKAELGEVSYKIDTSEIIWTLDNVKGKSAIKMMAELSLTSTIDISYSSIEDCIYKRFEIGPRSKSTDMEYDDSAKRELDEYYNARGTSSSMSNKFKEKLKSKPFLNEVSIAFSIPNLSYSGLRVTYLRVDEEMSQYTSFPWIKYILKTDTENELNKTKQSIYWFRLGVSNFLLEH